MIARWALPHGELVGTGQSGACSFGPVGTVREGLEANIVEQAVDLHQ